MKKLIVSTLAITMMLGSSAAFAWTKTSGTITNINASAHEITLDDGKTYSLQKTVSLKRLKVGEKVTINTEMKSGKNIVNKVTMSKT